MSDTAKKDETPAYYALCPTCQNVYYALVDDGHDPKWVADENADLMRRGIGIFRSTVADVKARTWCRCNAVQETLPLEETE